MECLLVVVQQLPSWAPLVHSLAFPVSAFVKYACGCPLYAKVTHVSLHLFALVSFGRK